RHNVDHDADGAVVRAVLPHQSAVLVPEPVPAGGARGRPAHLVLLVCLNLAAPLRVGCVRQRSGQHQ
ncbi:hypothetical protein pipiens_020355, partial [Culex pipiens pipiens]